MNRSRLRLTYAAVFALLLAVEIIIALFIRDSFIRPFAGDALVVALISAFLRIFIPERIKFLPFFVFLFACAVEAAQYFDFIKLLGLEDNRFFSILLGRTFDKADIICYFVGAAVFFAAERLLKIRAGRIDDGNRN